MGVNQGDLIDLPRQVLISRHRDRRKDVLQLGPVARLGDLGDDRHPQAAEVIATLSADRVEHGLFTLPDVGQRRTNGIDVQAAGQPAVCGNQDEQSFLDGPLGQEWMRRTGGPAGHFGKHLRHPVCVGPRGFRPGLHPA